MLSDGIALVFLCIIEKLSQILNYLVKNIKIASKC